MEISVNNTTSVPKIKNGTNGKAYFLVKCRLLIICKITPINAADQIAIKKAAKPLGGPNSIPIPERRRISPKPTPFFLVRKNKNKKGSESTKGEANSIRS